MRMHSRGTTDSNHTPAHVHTHTRALQARQALLQEGALVGSSSRGSLLAHYRQRGSLYRQHRYPGSLPGPRRRGSLCTRHSTHYWGCPCRPHCRRAQGGSRSRRGGEQPLQAGLGACGAGRLGGGCLRRRCHQLSSSPARGDLTRLERVERGSWADAGWQYKVGTLPQ